VTQPLLAKFKLDTSAEDTIPLLGDAELEVVNVEEDGHVIAVCDQGALATASFEGFPDMLTLHRQPGRIRYIFIS
jgi:hypothetical protein